ncbi:Aste57867_18273 [Aphanomyces stellatus]|uniref:Aste57867_18273 protein n=1 Tax=Aphanomyces stellatus TaxID=120398 RepID=A0A485L9X8_9STRA|nr:hypothetical protein As57867_018211 [Aphanomyces stellatus]VFT95010.1 Aste57867_18273 [Aphanomyces stellatus]
MANTNGMTWPELSWQDIHADVNLLTKSVSKKSASLQLALEESSVEAEKKLQVLASEIFYVHQHLTDSIHRVQCEAALVRVIQMFLLQQEVNPADTSLRQRAADWLCTHAGDWRRVDDSDSDGLLQCIREDIHSATTKEEFLQHMDAAAHSSVFFPVHTPDGSSSAPPPSSHLLGHLPMVTEAEAFQDAKDIKRDQLSINDVLFPGIVGYDALVRALADEIQRIAALYRPMYASFESTYDEMAKRILHTINRTESGGASYEILSHLVTPPSSPSLVLLRPNSKDATPLRIVIDMGAYEADAGWCFGLRVTMSTQTSYVLCDGDDPTTEWCVVHAVYRNRLAFSLGMSPFTVPTRGARRDTGRVQLVLN